MTIKVPHSVLRSVFDRFYNKTLAQLFKSFQEEYERNKECVVGLFRKAKWTQTQEEFLGMVRRIESGDSRKYLKESYPATRFYIEFLDWVAQYLKIRNLGIDVYLNYDADKDEVYPFRCYFGINLLQEISDSQIE